jgi:hypothetical protein
MKLNRKEAIDFLSERESQRIHGHSLEEIRAMSPSKLEEIVNKVFEPIDLDDPYTVSDWDLDRWGMNLRVLN